MSGWQSKKLSDVLYKTENIDPRKNPDSIFKYVDVSSVCNQEYKIKEVTEIKGKDAPSRARKLIKSGDILFATIRPTLKRIAQVDDLLDSQVCSTGYYVLRPKEIIHNRFLFYFLFTNDFMDKIARLQRGASYPAVNNGDVTSQKISFPPLEEQKRIVEILDEVFEGIDRAEANTKKKLENLTELKQSILEKAFSGELSQEIPQNMSSKRIQVNKTEHQKIELDLPTWMVEKIKKQAQDKGISIEQQIENTLLRQFDAN